MPLLAAQALVGELERPPVLGRRSRTPAGSRTTSHRDGRSVTSASVHVTGTISVPAVNGCGVVGQAGQRQLDGARDLGSAPAAATATGTASRWPATATRIRCPGRNRQPVAIRSSSTVASPVAGEVDRAAGDRLRLARRRDVVQLDRDDRARARMGDREPHPGRAQHLDRLVQRLALEARAPRLVVALVAEQPAVGRRRTPVAGGEADRAERRARSPARPASTPSRPCRPRPRVARDPLARDPRPGRRGGVVLLDEDHRARPRRLGASATPGSGASGRTRSARP